MSSVCIAHPTRLVQQACSRCGNYVCDECLASFVRSEPLCTACDEALVVKSAAQVRARATWVYAATAADLVVSGMVAVMGAALGPAGAMALVAATGMLSFVAVYLWVMAANRALAARKFHLEYGPHAWLWNFVPLAAIIVPYWVVRELYERTVSGPGFVLIAWWGSHVVTMLVRTFSTFAGLSSPGLETALLLAGCATDGMFAWVVYRATHGIAHPMRKEQLVPLENVQSEGMFADFR